jgi:riboflavin synthase
MFTGLIEELGEIVAIRKFNGGVEFDVHANQVLSDLAVDHSISVNGACQTVVAHTNKQFTIQAIAETLNKTNFKTYTVGTKVNLERAMRAHDRLGGHFVQGHVNGVGELSSVEHRGENKLIGITLPDELVKYCITEGSICIDGISLTIASISERTIFLSIIPHTWDVTNLAENNIGDSLNIEVDMMAKYIYQFMQKK